MKRHPLQISVLLILTAFLTTSAFSVYGLTSTNSGGKVDAIASATQAAPTSTPPAPKPAPVPAPVPKPAAKPVVKPSPPPAPVPSVAAPVAPSFTKAAFELNVLGKTLDLTEAPIILTMEGKTMLPLRKTAEAMGYTVRWDAIKKAALLENNGMSITLYWNSANYLRDTKDYTLSLKPMVVKNSLYVPTDFFTSDSKYRVDLTSNPMVIDVARRDVKTTVTTPKHEDSDEDEDEDDEDHEDD